MPYLLRTLSAFVLLNPLYTYANETMVITGAASNDAPPELQEIAGGANVILPQNESSLITLKDALDYQPGLILQEYFGGIDQPRLNIRGSGIQSNPVNRGILLLEDGLPLNAADGSFVIGTLEARDAQKIVVKRGANAREPGATTLGGSLNFIPTYGSNTNNSASIDLGSFGRESVSASLNTLLEQGDAHLSFSTDTSNGFRHHSEADRKAIRGNLGWVFNDKISSRFYLSYTDLNFQVPFAIPKDRINAAPESVMGDGNSMQDQLLNVYQRDPHRETEQYRLANKTRIQIDGNQSHEFGIYMQNTNDSMVDPLSHADTNAETFGLQWQYDLSIGRNNLKIASNWQTSDMQRDYFANNPSDGTKLQQFADLDLQAKTGGVSVLFNHALAPSFKLASQLRWNRNCRDALNEQNNDRLDQCWNSTNASLGINFKPNPQQHWFANLSSSIEAPTFWEITATQVAAGNPAMANLNLTELKQQEAVTLELGGRGQLLDRHRWDLAVYRSHIDDELISTANMVGTRGTTSNYSDRTIHQGLEVGLSAEGRLHYRLAWNYSDFTFDGGIYDGNNIAGIPEHLISAELGYLINDWDLSTNLRWMPKDTAVDHVNSLYQDDYLIWGVQADYQAPSGKWQAYIKIDNLTDETYASAFAIRNQSAPTQPTFLPGNGRSLNAGIKVLF